MSELRRPLQVATGPIQGLICTDWFRIEGATRIPKDGRRTDFASGLVRGEDRAQSPAVTNIRCRRLSDEQRVFTIDFINLNTQHVHLIAHQRPADSR
ncbi:MAG TPA: hypothetical protein VJO34_15095 [Methylomirabilota bacterium]|nr:hypothetical protein [Methylomirabilota bacterium]